MKIPVFNPEITELDKAAVLDALNLGEISGNFGSYLSRFEQGYADFCGVKHGIAVTSGTTALHLSIAALELPAGSEVLISSSTNIATALAVVHNNLVPVPVDSEMNTWNLDLDHLESLINRNTKAIIPVHLFGQPIDMDALMAIANKHGLKVVEDCAESHGATFASKMTGAFGDAGCFSFYANKILTTGEGGMVVTNSDKYAEKLRSYRNLGFSQPRFKHEIAAYNFRMTGYQAALGYSQLQRISSTIQNKIKVARKYTDNLGNLKTISLQGTLPNSVHVYWMYGILLKPNAPLSRDNLALKLAENGIETRTFFCPMDLQPALQKTFNMPDCPNAKILWENGLYLPSSSNLTSAEIDYVSEAVGTLLS